MARADDTLSGEASKSTAAQSAADVARQKVNEAAAKTQSIHINMDTALWQAAQERNLGEVRTDEIRFQFDGTTYITQGFSEGVVYVADGDWGNVQQVPA